MNSPVSLQDLTKSYGSQRAVDRLSLNVSPGTICALLGDNGAGKTTTIKILLGLTDYDSGHVQVLGMDPRRDGLQIRRQVGYVAERPTLYDWMTVDQIGWFTSGFYDTHYLTQFRQLATQYDLPSHQKIKHLSKGMRAKVSLALALAKDPPLLILDEPTSGLDTLVRREFLEGMVERAVEGQTVLLSSHQIHEVERVADTVAILRQGKLLVVDRLEKLKTEIQEITVTMSQTSSVLPPIEGELIRARRRSSEWQIFVRSQNREAYTGLNVHPEVHTFTQRTPSLEEIFVAIMAQKDPHSHEVSNATSPPADEFDIHSKSHASDH